MRGSAITGRPLRRHRLTAGSLRLRLGSGGRDGTAYQDRVDPVTPPAGALSDEQQATHLDPGTGDGDEPEFPGEQSANRLDVVVIGQFDIE